MGNRGLARTAVVEVSEAELSEEQVQKSPGAASNRSSGPPPDAFSAFYSAALLKLALELRRPEPRGLEETLARILEGTPVDREAFRAYLQRNFSLLRGV